VEYLNEDGLAVGYLQAADEHEVIGVDDPSSLEKVQKLYAERSEKNP
jgi:bifunctional N-acetylglucosamine-1-phosphate-uridyltransferase/glucosamine-1-phosphate-acetyltransferase GlmU-like protein